MGVGEPPEARRGKPGRTLYLSVLALGVAACAVVLGTLAWQTVRDREGSLRHEKDSLSRMAQSVATETSDMFDRINFFFQAADLWLGSHPGADPRTDGRFVALVDAFRSSTHGRVDIRLVSETGGLFYVPTTSLKALADVSDRAYYRVQMSPETKGFYIDGPVKSRVTGAWGIPISYPLASRNSGIAVIFASIEMDAFKELFDPIRPTGNGSISLTKSDGRFLTRVPFDEAFMDNHVATDVDAWWKALVHEDPAVFVLRSVSTDNAERIFATKVLPGRPLVVSVTSPTSEALKSWRDSLWWRALLALATVAVIGFASARLIVALRRLGEAQAELHDNLEKLRLSDATKNKLFSVIAHDLRGPIGGMASLLETMERDRSDLNDEELGHFIQALRATAWNTSQLLENLLAWAKSQRDGAEIKSERLLLLPLIEECEEVFRLSASEKGIAIETEVERGLEARADPDQLRILLRNLISNAVKFTSRGKSLRVRATKAEGGVVIEVSDEGIGIEASQLDLVFVPGALRSRAGTANERGSGLGLLLCKEIASHHGGRIEARSEVGVGSSFTVFLPD
jgi:Signal transduction histidine kinase